MLTSTDLPQRPFRPGKPAQDARLTPAAMVDAYFHLLALPASLWLAAVTRAHADLRRAAGLR